MLSIQIIQKPEWISYDDIHELLYKAHESNREKGFNVNTAVMSGEELQAHIGLTGKCFVALDGDKLVGTASYRIIKRDYWCVKGDVVDRVLVGVLPEYKGKHISSMLLNKIEEEAQNNGYKIIETRTAEENEIVQRACEKEGCKFIDFFSTKTDHYTVVMMRWLDGCPYNDFRIKIHFWIKKIYTKIRFKKGRIKRFGI